MVNDKEIKKLAQLIRELEGCSDGKGWDHYFRAKIMLEDGEIVLPNMNRPQTRVSAPLHRERFFNYAEIRGRNYSSLLDTTQT